MKDILPRKCFHLANGSWYCGICKRQASNPRSNGLKLPAAVSYHRALPNLFITAATAKVTNFVVENIFPRVGGWAKLTTAKYTGAPSGRSRKIRF